MSSKTIGYWGATAAICLAMGVGGIADVLLIEPVVEVLKDLGYPTYVGRIIGVWKILAVVALLAPGYPIVKEWAYAGVVIDLTGAAASHVAVGGPIGEVVTPVVLLGLTVASYLLRPASRRVGGG